MNCVAVFKTNNPSSVAYRIFQDQFAGYKAECVGEHMDVWVTSRRACVSWYGLRVCTGIDTSPMFLEPRHADCTLDYSRYSLG